MCECGSLTQWHRVQPNEFTAAISPEKWHSLVQVIEDPGPYYVYTQPIRGFVLPLTMIQRLSSAAKIRTVPSHTI